MNFSDLTRSEVMLHLEGYMGTAIYDFLKPIDENWQPTDFLPNASLDNFFDEIRQIQERAKSLSYDLFAVLIGDTITEEALPTYESWLFAVDGIMQSSEESGWKKWVRHWTAEENRHGDVLNKYLYLSGRVDMREMEASTQYLIADGFDIQTGNDPYRNFVYTSFQELATNISHRRVGTLVRKEGDALLSKICGIIAGDEARHAKAYMHFVEKIFEVDPNEMMLAFEDMMKKKIVMPAHFLREIGVGIGKTFGHFTDAAQRLEVYTAADYTEILRTLIKSWDIENMKGLKDSGEKAREYIVKLPDRLTRIAERMKAPSLEYKFKWILA